VQRLARAGDLFASKLVCALQARHLDAVTPDLIDDALRPIESATVSDAIVKVELEGAPCLHKPACFTKAVTYLAYLRNEST